MLVSDWRSICARVTVLVDCGVSRGVSGRRVEALSRAPEMVMLPSALGSCTNSSGALAGVCSAGCGAAVPVWAQAGLKVKTATARAMGCRLGAAARRLPAGHDERMRGS